MITTKSDPDKEPAESEALRMYAAIAYAVVLFVVGLPVWWYTTQLYRMALPDARMQALGVAPVTLQLEIHITVDGPDSFSAKVADEIQQHFAASDIFKVTVRHLQVKPAWVPRDMDAVDAAAERVPVDIGNIVLVEWPESPHHVLISSHRVVYYTADTTGSRLIHVISKWLLQEETLTHMVSNMKMPGLEKQDTTIRRRIAAADHYDIMVSIVNPDPDTLKIDWDPKAATIQYLTPFIDSISHISNFTLKTQWLYFVSLGDKVNTISDKSSTEWNGRGFALYEDQLPYLITMFEKTLSSHVSKNPCLNLVVYATHCKQAPLHIYNLKGVRYEGPNAFLSPRWGGIMFINPDPGTCKDCIDYQTQAVLTPDTSFIMSNFVSQLRQLVGIPELEIPPGVYVQPLISVSPREWELDGLLRLRALEQLVSARLTLKSLAQLLTEITTIVINDEVGASILSAVDNAEVAAELLAQGALEEAFDKSRTAFLSSENAFYDPSLLALLYFPDDQKYAIYIPLFLPIMIPVIMSLNTIRKWLWCSPEKPKID